MNEDFVSFDLAKKLKEKGYPQKPDHMGCMPYYEYDEVANYSALCNEIVWHMSSEPRDNIFAAPAIHKVLKWLREEKKIYLELIIVGAEYMCNIYKIEPRPVEWVGSTEFSETYESAAIAGFEYVIDNLI